MTKKQTGMNTYKLKGTDWMSEKPLTAEQKKQIEENRQKAKERNEKRKEGVKPDKDDKPIKVERAYEKASKAHEKKLNEVWEKYKPKEQKYELIDTGITIDGDNNVRGIINYRVGGEHKQIRI